MPCKKQPRRVTLTAQQAEAELEAAATALETRAKLLRIRTHPITPEAWETLAPHLRDIVPLWYRQMLSHFSVYGLGLEYRDQKNAFVRIFSFAGPDDYNSTMAPDSLYLPLLTHGFVPVGYESDGNLWVLRSPFDAACALYLLELTGWDGGEPTERNGLIFASSRFSLLLCSMGISEISYQDSPGGPTALIWHEDREPPPIA